MAQHGESDDDAQVLEYYTVDADDLVYSKLSVTSPTPGVSRGASYASSSSRSSTSYSGGESGTNGSSVGRAGSLRTSPRSPRGSTHRRVQIFGLEDSSAALVVPADLSSEFAQIKARPVSFCNPFPAGRRGTHNRSHSDPMARPGGHRKDSSESDASQYSDDGNAPESSDQSQSPDTGKFMSPLTPADATRPFVVGISSKDLAQGFQGPSFISYQPGIHSTSGPVPRLVGGDSAAAQPSAPPPRPPPHVPITVAQNEPGQQAIVIESQDQRRCTCPHAGY